MMNLQNNDNNNTSAYVKSMDEEEDIMQRAMEEKRDENIRTPYSTEKLMYFKVNWCEALSRIFVSGPAFGSFRGFPRWVVIFSL